MSDQLRITLDRDTARDLEIALGRLENGAGEGLERSALARLSELRQAVSARLGDDVKPRRRRLKLRRLGSCWQTEDQRWLFERRGDGWQITPSGTGGDLSQKSSLLAACDLSYKQFGSLNEAVDALAYALDAYRDEVPDNVEPVEVVRESATRLRTIDGAFLLRRHSTGWEVDVPGAYNEDGRFFLMRWGLLNRPLPNLEAARRELAEALWRESQRQEPLGRPRYPNTT